MKEIAIIDNKEFIKLITDLREYPAETEWLEFKVNWYKPDEVGEYIAALSNSAALYEKQYGYLIWGIENLTHKVVGTKFNYLREVKDESLTHYLARYLSPSVKFEFQESLIEKKRIVILIIHRAKGFPVSFKNERYLRIGSSKAKLSNFPDRESELFEVLSDIQRLVETESDDLDLKFNQLKNLYTESGKTILNEKSFYKNKHFYTKKGKFNLLAYLLADHNDISLLFCKFESTEKDPAAIRMDFGHQCLIVGSNKVIDYAKSFINTIHILVTSNPQREEKKLFDDRAFREAWINAIQYTDWNTGSYPRIFAYSDRIVIESFGGLPKSLTKEDFFKGIQHPKSVQLTEILSELNHVEHMGFGIPYIVRLYGKETFQFSEHTIIVSLPYKRIEPLANRTSNYEHQENQTIIITQAENNTIHVKSIIENSSFITPLKKKLLKIYQTFSTDIFSNSSITDLFKCSAPTASSYLEKLDKDLSIIVQVKGQGKGKYRFSEFPFPIK